MVAAASTQLLFSSSSSLKDKKKKHVKELLQDLLVTSELTDRQTGSRTDRDDHTPASHWCLTGATGQWSQFSFNLN